jgi:hypothetical protein
LDGSSWNDSGSCATGIYTTGHIYLTSIATFFFFIIIVIIIFAVVW